MSHFPASGFQIHSGLHNKGLFDSHAYLFNGGYSSYYDDDRLPAGENESDSYYYRQSQAPARPKYDPRKKQRLSEANNFFKNQKRMFVIS